ncbi:erythromycin esterase family protein [Planctomyces sp. SH-PL62]|uniref:erythromycin esterase family protein n=1 Tax=Planctomyces sp. SH-PL62 TaxID=1636152 RepID=UPI00078D6568|nr:erythromycin esterase family protein [Planctomyces sp. SH-PL62]AMV40072.1 Erythromycin esterase [Planctomyces sp. SH-PL62]
MARIDRLTRREARSTPALIAQVRDLALTLSGPKALDPLLDLIDDARYVLLGEASHGTAEYYAWRAAITRRLIVEKGFSFIAVEGDWPDCYRVDRYIKGRGEVGSTARSTLHAFERWPTWMWANEEVADLAEWLRTHNAGLPDDRKVGFYGLDVYSLWESLYAILEYLHSHDPAALPAAWGAFRCFEPYGEDVRDYARAARFVPNSCEDEVVALLRELRRRAPEGGDAGDDPEARFVAEQNGLVLQNAEAYYRAMVRGGSETWNLRDGHMVETLERLMNHHGPQARAIVWEHNTHVGDARYTDMAEQGEVNVGQLVRERHGDEGVVLVGFGSHRGSVIAGREWEAAMERMPVPPAREDSWEDVLHQAVGRDALLPLATADPTPEMLEPRGHRAIGVVYRPERERFGNYVPTVLPRRYDAFLYLETTRALHPLHEIPVHERGEAPDTYPWGE